MKLSVLVLMQLLIVLKVYGEECARPSELKQYEEDCFQEHSGIIEKVQQKATSWFEAAKKRLGIESDSEESGDMKPKKCEYYQCVLKKMHVSNQHGLPEFNSLKDRYGKELSSDTTEAQKCFAIADNIEKMMESEEDTVEHLNHDSGKTIKQARDTMNEILCEINSQVYRCLSQITYKDTKCPLFVFP